ncbi:MAG: hypothetical protein J7L39_01405, partial [Candidatus Aenigmarchaeota archaeon]|nr:hypothetical protein [Candidatus Aenigmarchaeota archaeon]
MHKKFRLILVFSLLFFTLVKISWAMEFGVKELELEKFTEKDSLVTFNLLIWSGVYPLNLSINIYNSSDCIIPRLASYLEIKKPNVTLISGKKIIKAVKLPLSFYVGNCKEGNYSIYCRITSKVRSNEISVSQERELEFKIIVLREKKNFFQLLEDNKKIIYISSVIIVLL